MKKTLPVLLALLTVASVGLGAQTTATLAFDIAADLTTTNGYTKAVKVDGTVLTAPLTCTVTTAIPALTTCQVAAPTLAAGTHTIEISLTGGGYTSLYSFTGVDPQKGPKDISGNVTIITKKVIPIP